VNDRTRPSPSYIQGWEIIKEWLANPVSVSTIATIDPSFEDFGNLFKDLMFVFWVPGTHAATFQIDHTEDPAGVFVEDASSSSPGAIPPIDCPAGKQASRRFMDISELGWRVSAFSSENGNPFTTVNRRILGRRRT
jgi:hypothetical protein